VEEIYGDGGRSLSICDVVDSWENGQLEGQGQGHSPHTSNNTDKRKALNMRDRISRYTAVRTVRTLVSSLPLTCAFHCRNYYSSKSILLSLSAQGYHNSQTPVQRGSHLPSPIGAKSARVVDSGLPLPSRPPESLRSADEVRNLIAQASFCLDHMS
jgi:hypothetical protein